MFDKIFPSDSTAESPKADLQSYPDLATYLAALRKFDVLFSPDTMDSGIANDPMLIGKPTVHCFETHRCVSFAGLRLTDLPRLRSYCSCVYVKNINGLFRDDFFSRSHLGELELQGFNIFLEQGSSLVEMGVLQRFRIIDLLEFVLSSSRRLAMYPAIANGRSYRNDVRLGDKPLRVVFVLDLIQDFEVLQPLLMRCIGSYIWNDIRVSVSDRVIKSHMWEPVQQFLQVMNVSWFRPLAPLDTVNALGSLRSVLITASESTANGHKFAHSVCKLAPKSTFKITVQHGYECVGLRHHPAHDLTLPDGVRFASDVVFTWASQEMLGDFHPADVGKCVPVGIVKTMAEETSIGHLFEHREMRVVRSAPASKSSNRAVERVVRSLLVAENLHSVRFLDAQRYHRFVDFINDANTNNSFALTIRSHPGKRTLEKDADTNSYKYLTGVLRANHFEQFDFFVSPPSTIVLDAILCGVPTAIWSIRRELGDCENYKDVPTVDDIDDLKKFSDPKDLEKLRLNNYRWALKNLAAFNGIPQAWSRMNELVF